MQRRFSKGGFTGQQAPAEGPAPPPVTDEVANTLKALLGDINTLHQARSSQPPASESRIAELESSIRVGMARMAQIHPDPHTRADYRAKLAKFDSGDESGKWDVLINIATGLGIILAAPFAIAGGAILLAGSIVQGTGQVLAGLGTLLTGPLTGKYW